MEFKIIDGKTYQNRKFELLSLSNTKVTHHYIGQLTVEQSMEINECLF